MHGPGFLLYWQTYTYKYNEYNDYIFSVLHPIQIGYAYQW